MLLLQALCFHKSLFTPTALHQWGTSVCMPCQYHALSCSHSQVLIMWITSSVPNFIHRFHHSELLISRKLRMLHWGYRADGVIFCDGFPSLQTCVWLGNVMMKQDFCWILVGLNSFEMVPEFSQCPDVCIGVECLQFMHHIHKNHTFTVPEDSDHDLTRWRRLFQFFPWENGDGAIPWVPSLTPVQNDGSRFHLL
jgi:hypothetical protein